MLGAVTSGAVRHPVSIPPRPSELTPRGKRDWQTGVELIETCVQTHDTATGLAPEIVHFRIPSDNVVGSGVPQDWYIKGAEYVSLFPPSPFPSPPFAFLRWAADVSSSTGLGPPRRTTRGTSCAPRRSSRCSSRTG